MSISPPSPFLVRDPASPSKSEPIIPLYYKRDTIQPVQVLGSATGITAMDSMVLNDIPTTAVPLVGSSVGVKQATLRVRSVGTGSFVAVGGVARQELRLPSGASVDLWCSNLDQVYVRVDAGSSGVVEVLYGY